MTHPRQVYVQPGEVHWSQEACVFKTVLGSCVSVCLWDAVHRIGGMTHFILPRGRGSRDARFGDVAIPLLVGKLRALGCSTPVAKLFGGAAVLPGGERATIGDCNTGVAVDWLQKEGIAIVAQRTGGIRGIVIQFSTLDGTVRLREITEKNNAFF
jgi:chemotaxis receptor (MCP) glutamine deamidase CheD